LRIENEDKKRRLDMFEGNGRKEVGGNNSREENIARREY
jgi:hypothetical protein